MIHGGGVDNGFGRNARRSDNSTSGSGEGIGGSSGVRG